MRFLVINKDYPRFLEWFYGTRPGLERRGYEEQLAARYASFFALADFYSRNLRQLGHEAWDVQVNNEPMQRAWAREHGVRLPARARWQFRLRRGLVPWIQRREDESWMYQALAAQIRHFRPDILMVTRPELSGKFFQEVKPLVRLVIGQHAAPMPAEPDFAAYDLMLSSLPNLVTKFRSLGLRSELLRLGFEPRVLESLAPRERDVPVSFVGSITPHHRARIEWLRQLSRSAPLELWGDADRDLLEAAGLAERHRGPLWGHEMFAVLGRSRITLNHHIDVADDYANNVRLYEATGMGALLVTDSKRNLAEMFEPGREVIAYRSAEECAEQIRHYLDRPEERQAVARAGQARTLRDHTYACRMRELLDILKPIL
jgi:hypothetical protein